MTLGERIKIILKEKKIKQIEFAKSLGISANYVNLLANDKKNIVSNTLAKLIEETYGYSSQWLLTGNGSKNINQNTSINKSEIIKKIDKMSDDEINSVLAYVETLQSIKSKFIDK